MKQLNEYIKEGLFDNVDKLEGKNGLESTSKQIEKEIKAWICEHYFDSQSCAKSRAIKKSNLTVDMTTTPPTVNYNWPGHNPDIYIDLHTESLCNNRMFQWGEMNILEMHISGMMKDIIGAPKKIRGTFTLHSDKLESLEGAPEEAGWDFVIHSKSLKSLEGAPEKVGGCFICSRCHSLESLEGAPKRVGRDFDCSDCEKLTSLKGAPKEIGGSFSCGTWMSSGCLLKTLEGAPNKVGWDFKCSGCDLLTSLEGAPKVVGGSFNCCNCTSLKSLKGAPKEVGRHFDCHRCGVRFTKDDVRNVSYVKSDIYC